MSIRNEKITSTLTRALQQVFTLGLHDPRTHNAMISVTSVDLSPDGRNATVNVSVLPEKYEARVHAGLNHSTGFIRRSAAELLHLKIMPQLAFVIDRSLKKQAAVIEALSKVAAEREAKSGKPADSPTGSPISDAADADEDTAATPSAPPARRTNPRKERAEQE